MKLLILGIISIIWGSAIIIRGILSYSAIDPNTSYGAGIYAGLGFGLVLIIAGVFSLVKWKKSRAQ